MPWELLKSSGRSTHSDNARCSRSLYISVICFNLTLRDADKSRFLSQTIQKPVIFLSIGKCFKIYEVIIMPILPMYRILSLYLLGVTDIKNLTRKPGTLKSYGIQSGSTLCLSDLHIDSETLRRKSIFVFIVYSLLLCVDD